MEGELVHFQFAKGHMYPGIYLKFHGTDLLARIIYIFILVAGDSLAQKKQHTMFSINI